MYRWCSSISVLTSLVLSTSHREKSNISSFSTLPLPLIHIRGHIHFWGYQNIEEDCLLGKLKKIKTMNNLYTYDTNRCQNVVLTHPNSGPTLGRLALIQSWDFPTPVLVMQFHGLLALPPSLEDSCSAPPWLAAVDC